MRPHGIILLVQYGIWMEYHNSVSEGGVGGGVLFLWSVSVEVVVVMWTEIEEKT